MFLGSPLLWPSFILYFLQFKEKEMAKAQGSQTFEAKCFEAVPLL